jgi:hypothetical protein
MYFLKVFFSCLFACVIPVENSKESLFIFNIYSRWVDNIKMDLRKIGWDGMDWSIGLRMGTSGGLLWIRWWTSGFHKMLGSSRVAAQFAASQEGLSCMREWVSEWVIIYYRFTWRVSNVQLHLSWFSLHISKYYCNFSLEGTWTLYNALALAQHSRAREHGSWLLSACSSIPRNIYIYIYIYIQSGFKSILQ